MSAGEEPRRFSPADEDNRRIRHNKVQKSPKNRRDTRGTEKFLRALCVSVVLSLSDFYGTFCAVHRKCRDERRNPMSHRTVFFAAAALMVAATAWAHHNMSAIYDFNDKITMTGTLTKIDWRNPHIELIVDSKNGAELQTWSLEGPSPSFFRARDINRS